MAAAQQNYKPGKNLLRNAEIYRRYLVPHLYQVEVLGLNDKER
jgi:hypothetical protein